jgi:fructose-bisphosphate aldolase class I
MSEHELSAIAQAIVAPGKGILAADESSGTIKKRLAAVNLESTEEYRQAYRELLFTTKGVEEFISGVILFDETIRQSTSDGKPFPKVLANKGILPGIKVDKGTVDMPGFPGEKVTEGMDGLRQRLSEYVQMGAKFTKWRTVYSITNSIPTQANMEANAYSLAQFAALTQEAGMVPIIEPEVLMDGENTLERCEEVTTAVLEAVFAALYRYNVLLEGTLLKPNMVISGKGCPTQASAQEIAEATIRTLKRTVPSAIPGIVFLSGGQSPAQAAENLSAMNKIGGFPWQLSFSYGRALQDEAIRAWRGEPANVAKAQEKFYNRSRLNGLARYGKYTRDLEPVAG